MNLFGKFVTISTGKLNQKTQRVDAWGSQTIEFTSSFAINVQNKIASELTKISFNHVKYKRNEKGTDTLISMAGSDIDEVLNWSPKGRANSMEFWSDVVKRLMSSKKLELVPVYNERTGELLDLRFRQDTDKDVTEDETVNLYSPFYLNNDTSILDNALSAIVSKLDQGKIRALYQIHANLDLDFREEFQNKAKATIEEMQRQSTFNGIVPVDNKGKLIELKKDYSVLSSDEIDLIKSELLGAYFMNENILNGTASQEEQMYFYNSTIIPIMIQLEKELTYKLLTSNTRRVTTGNIYYQRIVIDNQLFKFASLKELIDLYHENTNAPIFTINELRVKMGEQPIEGGDKYFTNKNAIMVNDFDDLAETKEDNSEKKGTDETS